MDIDDILCLNGTNRHCGVGNYVLMMEELLGKERVATIVLDKNRRNWDYPGTVYHGIYPPVTSGWWINTTFYKRVYRSKGLEIPDFVHLLDVTTLFPSRKQRGIVTVHDLYHKHRTYGSKKFMDKLMERLLPWDYILSDSHASIPELESVGFSEDQIKVVHLAVRDGIWFKMDEEEISGLIQEKFPIICQVQKPIVLTVGDAKHKNNHLTNEAVKNDYFHIHVGSDVQADLNLRNITDDDLRLLFNIASVYVRPSDFEGFGLPAVEALMCGTPAVVSDIPVYRETMGSSGVFTKIEKESVLEGIKTAIKNSETLVQSFNKHYRDYYSIKRFNKQMTEYYRKIGV